MSNKAVDKIFMANILRKKAEEEAKKRKRSKNKPIVEHDNVADNTATEKTTENAFEAAVENAVADMDVNNEDMAYENNTEDQTVAD